MWPRRDAPSCEVTASSPTPPSAAAGLPASSSSCEVSRRSASALGGSAAARATCGSRAGSHQQFIHHSFKTHDS